MKFTALQGKGKFRVENEVCLASGPETVFSMFDDSEKILMLYPEILQVTFVDPLPERLSAGDEFSYSISIAGMKIVWTTKILQLERPRLSVHEQTKGPWIEWLFRHELHEIPGGTRIFESFEFELRAGVPFPAKYVEAILEKITAHRNTYLQGVYGAHSAGG